MEQWRHYETSKAKLLFMLLSSVALGGCGIWCTHFTGMSALKLRLSDGTELEIRYEVGMTTASFIFPVIGVFIGLNIASRDPFFLEIEAAQRKELLMKQMKSTAMKDVVKKDAVVRRIKVCRLGVSYHSVVKSVTEGFIGMPPTMCAVHGPVLSAVVHCRWRSLRGHWGTGDALLGHVRHANQCAHVSRRRDRPNLLCNRLWHRERRVLDPFPSGTLVVRALTGGFSNTVATTAHILAEP
jgi:hypothetical protein